MNPRLAQLIDEARRRPITRAEVVAQIRGYLRSITFEERTTMPALRAESRRRLVGKRDQYAKAFPAWIRLLPGFLAALTKVIQMLLDDVDEEI